MLRGTDISAYQASIPGGDFCIMKATEGLSYNDPPFASRWKTLGQRGTLRGAYHFAHPSNDPVAEADHFLSIVTGAGLAPGDVLVLDHETPGSSPGHDAAWALAWCQHVQAKTGVRPVLYTFLSFAQAGRCAGLGGFPLWIADPSSPAGSPRVPLPWTHWTLHQYGSPGGVDADVFAGDRAAWLALGAGHTPTPTPTPLKEDLMYGQLNCGVGAVTPVSFKPGTYTAVGFVADAKVDLQVECQSAPGTWDVVKATYDPAAKKGKTVIHFPHPGTTDALRIRRVGVKGVGDDAAVGWDAS